MSADKIPGMYFSVTSLAFASSSAFFFSSASALALASVAAFVYRPS